MRNALGKQVNIILSLREPRLGRSLALPSFISLILRHHAFEQLPMHVCQSHVSAAEADGELLVIDPQ